MAVTFFSSQLEEVIHSDLNTKITFTEINRKKTSLHYLYANEHQEDKTKAKCN